MTIEVSSITALIVLALATYLTRIGGVLIMSRIGMTRRIERGLDALAGSVLIAIVVPATMAGDMAAKLAVVTAVGLALLTRNNIAAMGSGLAVAALTRAIV